MRKVTIAKGGCSSTANPLSSRYFPTNITASIILSISHACPGPKQRGLSLYMNDFSISIPRSFKDYVDSAIARASYLYPNLRLEYSRDSGESIVVSSEEPFDFKSFKKDFLNILYRERIYSETLPIRKTLYRTE